MLSILHARPLQRGPIKQHERAMIAYPDRTGAARVRPLLWWRKSRAGWSYPVGGRN